MRLTWYKDYPWLTLCITSRKAFCFYCRLYYEQKELSLSKNIEPAFIRDGFNNWKKALYDAAKLCVIVRDCLGLVGEMLQLIKYSPKRYLVFEKCQKEFSPESPGLRPLCPTWWTVRTSGALDSILKNYETLIHTFGDINTTSHDDYGRRFGGVVTQLELFQTYFGFRLCHLVFAITEEV